MNTLKELIASCKGLLATVAGILLCSTVAFSQNVVVTGTVLTDTNEPAIGASVIQVGNRSNGVVADLDGKFSITVPSGSKLEVSSIGFLTQTVTASKSPMKIVLMTDAEMLEETVFVGYGTQKKTDVTGSVASVDAEQMMKRTPTNIVQGLQGAAAGVVITQSSGDPTGGYSIRIRGVATMNGDTNPLWVVDGVQYGTSSSLSWLDPQDVESIEILKDASATAIYGSRGANGVILVTTKKGSVGKATVQFKADFGLSTYANRLKMASLDQFLNAYRISCDNDGMAYFNAFNGNYDNQLNEIDWQDTMTQTAVRQQYNVSISGGSESAKVKFSLGYLDNKGIIVNSWNKRLTMRLNGDFQITNWLKAGAAINFNTSKGKSGGNMINYARIVPTMDYIDQDTGVLVHMPVYDEATGTYGHFTFQNDVDRTGGRYQTNAYWDRYEQTYGKDWDLDSGSVRTSGYVDITFFKGFTFRSNINYDFSGSNSWSYTPALIRTQYEYSQHINDSGVDSFSTSGSASTNMGIENYFTFDRTFGSHHLTAMVGQSASMTHGSWNSSSTQDLTFNFLRGFYSTDKIAYNDGNGGPNISARFLSYFARLNYVLADRYMLTATIRRDGSSNFGKSNRWGTFPSFSFAWRVSEEPWMKSLTWLSNLKFRAGWGQTGNANVSPTASVPQVSGSGVTFDVFDPNGVFIRQNGIAQTSEIDTGLQWETSVQTNVGVDLGFLKNSLTFSADYYIRNTEDLILAKAIRPSAGFTSITTNFGSIKNWGWEFALAYKKQLNRDWFISASATASTNKNQAIDIGSGTTTSGPTGSGWENKQVCYNGLALGTYQGYVVDHIISNQSEIDALNAKAVELYGEGSYYDKASTGPGDFLFVDTNGDGHITAADKQYLGNGFVKLNYGLNLSASWKNFDASVYMYGVLGQEVLSWAKCYLTSLKNESNGYFNLLEDTAVNSWTPENTGSIYPKLSRTDESSNFRVSDYFVEKADYLKISNVQIGYTFTSKALHNVLRSARIYASIQNLATISPYCKYGDPEISGGVTTTGYDSGRYPFPRTFMFGVQFSL